MLKSVLIVVENLPAPFDRRAWREAITLRKAGYRVSILSPKGKDYTAWHEIIDGIHVYRYPMPFEAKTMWGYFIEYPWSLSWEFFIALWLKLFGPGFDAIHLCDPPDFLFLVALPFKIFGTKMVFDHHDLSPELFVVKFGHKGFWYKVLLWFERMSYRFCDVAISPNQSYKEIAITRNRMNPDRVFVVRSAPSQARLTGIEPLRDHLFSGKKLVGYVGVIGSQEGLDLLVDAVHHLVFSMKKTDVMFLVMGEGPALEDVKAYAREKRVLGKHMRFLGYVPDKEMLPTLAACHVAVNPDRVNEFSDRSTMNKVIEYMALGVPVVMFETTEGKFSAGDAALYAKPNDPVDLAEKIAWLLDHPEQAKKMGETGKRRFSDQLKWEKSEPNLLRAYRALFQVNKGG